MADSETKAQSGNLSARDVLTGAVALSAVVTGGATAAALGLVGLGALGFDKAKAMYDDSKVSPPPPQTPYTGPAVDPMGNLIGYETSSSDYSYAYDYGGGGGDGGGCVEVHSRLPGELIAGEVEVGNSLQLSDDKTLQSGTGIVSFSQRKSAPGFRITTDNFITLICSDTAPIPTREGLVLAPELMDKSVATRVDSDGVTRTEWRKVTAVEPIGQIEVQHITVGDKCFWAGEKANRYILHHNTKASFVGSFDVSEWLV